MLPSALALLAGAISVLGTHRLFPEGSFFLAILVVVAVGGIVGATAVTLRGARARPHVVILLLGFAVGVAAGEGISFMYYYLTYGYHDPKLGVGVAVSELEFLVVAVVGCVSLLVTALLAKYRITTHSSGRRSGAA